MLSERCAPLTFAEADAAYPYDPRAKPDRLFGIAKMRCFEDPKMRRNVFDAMSTEPPVAPAGYVSWDKRIGGATAAAVREEHDSDPTAGRYGE